MKVGVIYCLLNKINNKRYIGKTKNFNKRINQHKIFLNKNFHYNEHLQKSWNKYGENNFEFLILFENIPIEYLDEYEKFSIDFYSSYKSIFGYNKTFGGEGNSDPFESTKLKMSNSHKILENIPERKKNNSDKNSGLNNAMFGKSVFEIWKEKYGETIAQKMWHDKYENYSFLFSGKNNPMYGQSFYDIWINKYDKEIADKKYNEFIEKQKKHYNEKKREQKSLEKKQYHKTNPTFKCKTCNNVFSNFGTLGTHKKYYCVGVK